MVVVKCETCGKEFETYPSNIARGWGRFCSRVCKYKSQHKVRNCEECGKGFVVPNSSAQRGWGRFCSKVCAVRSGQAYITCETCRKRVRTTKSKKDKGQRFCSKGCYDEWQRRDRVKKKCVVCKATFSVAQSEKRRVYCSLSCAYSDRYRGRRGVRSSGYPREFDNALKKRVRKRDKQTCAICRKLGRHVHHIDFNKFNNRMDNLITLCASCHAGLLHKDRASYLGRVAKERQKNVSRV